MEQREYIVEAEGAGQRIDRFLSGEDTAFPGLLCRRWWPTVMCCATASWSPKA